MTSTSSSVHPLGRRSNAPATEGGSSHGLARPATGRVPLFFDPPAETEKKQTGQKSQSPVTPTAPPQLAATALPPVLAGSLDRWRRSAAFMSTSIQEYYPMWVMSIDELLSMDKMRPHQALLRDGRLRKATADLAGRVIFVSHQWTGFAHPDPHADQLRCLQRIQRRMMDGSINQVGTHRAVTHPRVPTFTPHTHPVHCRLKGVFTRHTSHLAHSAKNPAPPTHT